MATADDVKKLAALARITIADDELAAFTSEFDAILNYVGQLESLDLPETATKKVPPLHNIFREDGEPTVPGTHTEKLTAQFPEREDDYLVVKQIIQHD